MADAATCARNRKDMVPADQALLLESLSLENGFVPFKAFSFVKLDLKVAPFLTMTDAETYILNPEKSFPTKA